MGRLEVIAGPMFSGKTAELVRRVQLAQIACMSVAVFRPAVDTRHRDPIVWSRAGSSMEARIAESSVLIAVCGADVVAIDEAQFFDSRLPSAVRALMDAGQRVIVAGLDLDYTEHPFGVMPELLALADDVMKATAVCVICHSMYANRTQRLIDGKPAAQGEQVVIDRQDKYRIAMAEHGVTYEARCSTCFVSPLAVLT